MSKPTTPRPTMVDVGQLAGVSAQTVSRYFTGKGYVHRETRDKIQAAIDQLNYQFNASARNLRANITHTVGFLATGPLNHGTSSILTGLSEAAFHGGYALLTSQLDVEPHDPAAPVAIRQALDRFLSARVDGLVVSSPYPGIEDLLEHVWETVPVVILSVRSWPNADSATVDSYEAGLLATTHLLELGHTKIIHIAGPSHVNEAEERERGYRTALDRAGVEPLPVPRGDWSAHSGALVGDAVDVDSFTAVFSGNDQMALGFMSAVRRRGKTAPEDFSIVGVDDMPDARYFTPALTSIYMDFVSLGRVGFEMLIQRITTADRVERRVIHPQLIVRESTAPLEPTAATLRSV